MLMQVPLGKPSRGRRGLREYRAGFYPVPAWSYGAMPPAVPGAAPCCGQKRRRRSLGDDYSDYVPYFDSSAAGAVASAPSVATSTGSVLAPYNPAIWVGSGVGSNTPVAAPPDVGIYSVAPGGGTLTSSQLASIAALTGAAIGSPTLPAASPSTLLAAAALPNASAAVKAAAAAYSAANPVSSFLSSSILGLPTYAVLGAGVVALLLLGAKKGR